MPQSMTVTAPNGKTLTIQGDRVPTESELHDIFKQAGVETGAGPAASPTARAPLSQQAEQMLSRTDLPDDVRHELDAIRTGTTPQTPWFGNLRQMVDAWGQAGPHAIVQGLKDVRAGNYSKGAHEIITGAGVTAAPMLAPEAIPAIVAAPGAAALTVGAGLAAQQGASAIAKQFGASEDQATLAGDVVGAGAGTAMAKLGIPALAKWSANNRALAMGKSYNQSTRDIQAALGVNAEDVHRARPFLEAVHNTSIPIVGKEANGGATDQFVKAANAAIDEIEQHVAGLVRQFPTATVAPADNAVIRAIAQMRASSPADLAAARREIARWGLNRPRNLIEAEDLRIRLNAENRSVSEGSGVRQRTSAATDGAFVARQAAADHLRNEIYGALEQRGIEGVRDLRLSEGSILKLRNAADPSTRGLRSESTVVRTGESSLTRRVVQRLAPMVGASAGASIAGTPGAAAGAEVGRELTAGLTAKNLSKNELLERAFRQSFTSPPVMSVQRIPQFTSPAGRPGLRPLPSHRAPGLLPPAALPPGE